MQSDVVAQRFGEPQTEASMTLSPTMNIAQRDDNLSPEDPITVDVNNRPQTAGNLNAISPGQMTHNDDA